MFIAYFERLFCWHSHRLIAPFLDWVRQGRQSTKLSHVGINQRISRPPFGPKAEELLIRFPVLGGRKGHGQLKKSLITGCCDILWILRPCNSRSAERINEKKGPSCFLFVSYQAALPPAMPCNLKIWFPEKHFKSRLDILEHKWPACFF